MNDRIDDLEASPPGKSGVDKMDRHYRQQLSALIDGALAPDEARFLLRRMQHDHELAECWERWQIAGEVMRGRATTVLPAGFAMRVSEALAAEAKSPIASVRQQPQWLRWGGGAALAASVAVVAMLMARQAPDREPVAASNAAIVAMTPPPSVEASAPVRTVPSTQGQALAAAAVASVAAADAPRRAAQRMRTSTQRTRVPARRTPAALDATRIEVAAAGSVSSTQSAHPFATGSPPIARPWPRAVLPQFGGSGVLTADSDASASPSFYPFQPRLLPDDAAQRDPAPPTPR